jgi:hypothetical protein
LNTEQNRTEAKKKLPTQHWILQLEQSKSVENNQVENNFINTTKAENKIHKRKETRSK